MRQECVFKLSFDFFSSNPSVPAVLRLDPKDKDALQAKLFLLLQIEQYSAALTLLHSLGSSSEGAFEKAYSLYRLQRESEASQILIDIKQSNVDDRGVLHLEAQLVWVLVCIRAFFSSCFPQSYRQGSYHAAFDLYNQLLDTADPVRLFPRSLVHSVPIVPRSKLRSTPISSRISKHPNDI